MSTLPALPPTLASPAGSPLWGRWVGYLEQDPLTVGPRKGRARRWYYAAAGDAEVSAGAAVAVLGPLAVTFAWAQLGDRTVTWERRVPLRRGAWVARTPAGGAGAVSPAGRVVLAGDGSFEIDVPITDRPRSDDAASVASASRSGDGGPSERLRVTVEVVADVAPVVLVTETPTGGWNCTQKAAGSAVVGRIVLGAVTHELGAGAGGWRDWTSGRQDRTTVWRWAAGAGRAADGRQVGLNVSSGMNARAEGEDLVWWDGVPVPLPAHTVRPVSESELHAGWELGGPGWSLSFHATGVRAKHERLPLLTSRYVHPIGRFTGTLPDPAGVIQEVTLTGVTEDHLAIW
jgi:hypothetical protein